jgi:hypothetical protein
MVRNLAGLQRTARGGLNHENNYALNLFGALVEALATDVGDGANGAGADDESGAAESTRADPSSPGKPNGLGFWTGPIGRRS